VNEDGGSIPIAQDKSDPTDGKTTLVVSRKFARIFQQIAENDVLFEYYPKWGEGKEETRKPRVVSVAKGLLYRLMKHEMRDGKGGGHLKEDGFAPEKEANMIGGRYALVNDAICLWFVGAYCFTDSTRYDNITLKKRLKYLRKESGMDFDRYFPNLSRDGDFNEAVEIALGVNYMFFNRRQPGEDYLFKAIDYRTLDTENERATTAIDVRKALRDLEAARPRVEAIREINIDSVKFGPEGRKYILDKKNRRVVIFPAEAGITDTGSAEKAIDLSVRINEAFSIAGFELDENGNIYVYSDKDSTIFSFTALGAPGKAFVGMGDTGFKTVNVKRGKITAANDNTLYRSALAGGEIEIVDALTYKTFSRGTKKVDLDINGNYWFLCEGYEGGSRYWMKKVKG
jgi:hypothetical protein